MMAVTFYGFAAFIIIRHIKGPWIRALTTITSFIICGLAGLAPLMNQLQYPSDVIALYMFGGVWLCLNIILMEVFRIFPNIKVSRKV